MTHLLFAILLVLNKADATLAFVDPVSLQVTSKIPTGNGPHEVAVSTDNKIALVANYGTGPDPGSSVSIVDLAARKELKRLALPLLRPHGVFAIGSHIYFTAEGSRVVARYDVAGGAIDWISGSGANVTHMVVVMPGEKKIYTANIGSDSVSVFDLANAPRAVALKQIAVGKGPEGIDFSPNAKEIWVSHRGDAALSIIDTSTDAVTQTVTTGTKMANRVKFTLDGKRVLISDPPSNQVLVYDATTRQLVKKLDVEKGPSGILIAPDGKRAFVACSEAGKVIVLDLNSLTVTGSVATGNQPDGMAWAADR
ncbi:MAG TPA: YncE family protein [Thermoanaerobaculia bacterium]|nr:YncE family protein [Thermoanaerobaculia bacterium]